MTGPVRVLRSPPFLGADREGVAPAPGAEAGAMDYLFGIVVLLCGVVQAGRGAKPKHNVPRLKLSYKGKPPHPTPPTHDSGSRGAALQPRPACFPPPAALLHSPFFVHSFFFWTVFVSFFSSSPVNLFLPASLLHSSILVSKQHLTGCLTGFVPLARLSLRFRSSSNK